MGESKDIRDLLAQFIVQATRSAHAKRDRVDARKGIELRVINDRPWRVEGIGFPGVAQFLD